MADTLSKPNLNNHYNKFDEDSNLYPVFSKATSILFNTGNIVSSKRIKKKTSLLQNDEILGYLETILHSWLPNINHDEIKEQSYVVCRHPEYYERLDDSERDEVTISVKLFLNSYDPNVFENAINSILDELNAKNIDSFIISLPNSFFDKNDLQKELILPLWSIIERKLDEKILYGAGISDFNKIYLEQFCNEIKNKNYLPIINQVNLSSCCKMPEDLLEYAKAHNIQLTTHSDQFILKDETIQKGLLSSVHEFDAYGWAPLWLARYTFILKGRGIVKSKGYLLNVKRDLKYTK